MFLNDNLFKLLLFDFLMGSLEGDIDGLVSFLYEKSNLEFDKDVQMIWKEEVNNKYIVYLRGNLWKSLPRSFGGVEIKYRHAIYNPPMIH